MKLKAIIFIALFVVLTHQLTLDEQLDKAREAEHKALGELKLQYENAKEQFKSAFHKLKGDADTSDSDITIQKGITDAETADDSTKAGEWKAVSGLKAQAQKAKEAYKSAMAIEHQYIDELKLKAKNAKGQFKAAFNKVRGVTASDSSDAEIQEGINTAESASDTAKAEEWRGVSGLKAQYQKAKETYKTAKADLKSKIGSLSEEALGAEHKALYELKNQVKNAKEQFKAAFKKIRGNCDSSDSSDSDSAIQKGIETADTAQDVAKSDEWKAVRELKAQYQKTKDLYQSSKENLKAKFTKTPESSDLSSDSSDSSDADINKSKWGQEWAIITQLKNQAKRARQSARDAYNSLKGLYHRGSDSSSSSSDSSDGAVKEKVVEKIEEKAVEEAQSLLEQAKNAQITAYLELKEGAKRAKDIFKSTYRDLKAKIRGEKAQPQVDPDL